MIQEIGVTSMHHCNYEADAKALDIIIFANTV
jgi:hypothetical protein